MTLIFEGKGNLLRMPVEALVNTVNTEGVMGKGIALQFKKAYPAMFKDYAAAAKRGEVKLGRMHVWSTGSLVGPQFIINFPTKAHWRTKSKLADIESGLDDLVRVIEALGIRSLAVPPLGCGNGGLHWGDVEPLIREALSEMPNLEVHLFPPAGAPKAAEMVDNTESPPMTASRAALVGILDRYSRQALESTSLIETQKLMYFLQESGEPLRLRFEANRYGPYADNLRHVLKEVEGHFISGYGDGSGKALDVDSLTPISNAIDKAERVLDASTTTRRRMSEVLKLVEGFESAYGLELLATVHWVARSNHSSVTMSHEAIAQKISEWSPRKNRMFTPEHVEFAFRALENRGWLAKTSNSG